MNTVTIPTGPGCPEDLTTAQQIMGADLPEGITDPLLARILTLLWLAQAASKQAGAAADDAPHAALPLLCFVGQHTKTDMSKHTFGNLTNMQVTGVIATELAGMPASAVVAIINMAKRIQARNAEADAALRKANAEGN